MEKIIKLVTSKKKILAFLFFFIFLHSPLSNALTNNVVATVDNAVITELDIKKEIEFLKFINKSEIDINSIKIKKEITELLINRKIKKIEVNNAKIQINDKETDDYLYNYLINQKIDNEVLNDFYKAKKIEEDYLRNIMEIDLKWIKLIRQSYEGKIDINLTEVNKEIKKESNKDFDNEKLKIQIIASEKDKLLTKYANTHLEKSKRKYLIKFQ